MDTLPLGNVDIAPTLLWLMDVKPMQPLDGRVLSGLLKINAALLGNVELGRRDAQVKLAGGVWSQYLTFVAVNGVRYFDEGNGQWMPSAAIVGKVAK